MTFASYGRWNPDLLPLRLGDPTRCHEERWKDWGIDIGDSRDYITKIARGELGYIEEWAGGDPSQRELVSRASSMHMADNPQALRNSCGIAISNLLYDTDFDKTPWYMLAIGVGGGACLDVILSKVDEKYKRNLTVGLNDVSAESLATAEKVAEKHGVRHETLACSDIDLPKVMSKKADVVYEVAAIHHHPKIPWKTYYDVTNAGGFFVLGDWHVSDNFWTPYGVYKYILKESEWDKKEDCLWDWEKAYPIIAAIENDEVDKKLFVPSNPNDLQADRDMGDFWRAYTNLHIQEGGHGRNAIYPMEGHVPSYRYVQGATAVGFNPASNTIRQMLSHGIEVPYTLSRYGKSTETGSMKLITNPHQIFPGTSLLNVSVFQKPDLGKRVKTIFSLMGDLIAGPYGFSQGEVDAVKEYQASVKKKLDELF